VSVTGHYELSLSPLWEKLHDAFSTEYKTSFVTFKECIGVTSDS